MVRLRRTSPEMPGWTRRRAGKGFSHRDEQGAPLAPEDLARVKALVIPPAWRDVWICPHPNGHLQAVGTDEAGRRQYLYHPQWRAMRDAEKFDRVVELGRALPRLRRGLARSLASTERDLEWACALTLSLLDHGYFRVGSAEYTEEHGSFGLTTLRREHVRVRSGVARFDFVGKAGVEQSVLVDDERCVAALRSIARRRSGPDEFLCHRDANGWRCVEAEQVNEHLREATGLDVTAKDFRTWHGTVLAGRALARADREAGAKARSVVASAMEEVASALGNTPSVARSAYVDPRVVAGYERGITMEAPDAGTRAAVERSYLDLIERLGGG